MGCLKEARIELTMNYKFNRIGIYIIGLLGEIRRV